MIERINIAELLKGCPLGMELDCTICNGTVAFEGIVESAAFPIRVVSKSGFHYSFTKHGFLYDDEESKCVIFPKGKDSWEGFTPPVMFKDGDVVLSENGMWLAITAGGISTDLVPVYCLLTILNNNLDIYETNRCFHFDRLAIGTERKKLHKAIEDAGFRWNSEEKRLEEIPVFSDGDVVATKEGNWIGIVSGGREGQFCPTYCTLNLYGEFDVYTEHKEEWLFNRLATETEKNKLFDAIKDNGYVWNAEEKRLEEIEEHKPGFKDGDIVATDTGNWIFIFESSGGEINNCHVAYDAICDDISLTRSGWSFSRYATEEEKEKLFTAIKKNGYVWNAETKKLDKLEAPKKFDISTLKPFDKVLVRDSYREEWNVDFFGYRRNDGTCRCMTFTRNQCIPFEGNEHLLGTTDPCADFYNT